MGPTTRYTLKRNTAGVMKIIKIRFQQNSAPVVANKPSPKTEYNSQGISNYEKALISAASSIYQQQKGEHGEFAVKTE